LLTKRGKKGFTRRLIDIYNLKIGDKVAIIIDSSIHKGMPHRRYHGHIGKIISKKTRSYAVGTTKGKKNVTLLVRPEHLRKIK
jgi:large subunit ribosomal protein L21e